jgi:hypothetical protein
MIDQTNKTANFNLTNLLDALLGHVDTTSELAAEIVECIKKDERDLQNRKIDLLNDALSVFVEGVITLHSKYKAFENYSTDEMNSLKSSKIHLLGVLKGIKMALEKSDNIMLIDLIEYELRDSLTQWKIRVLPKLKSLII